MPLSMGISCIKHNPREYEQRNNPRSACGKKPNHLQTQAPSLSPLFFHPYTKGSQIKMDSSHHCAWRKSGFCNGITFTNRPVLIQEKVRLKITKTEESWQGGMRLGCTIFDPSLMHPDALPKFVCPDLEEAHGFWVSALPQQCIHEGSVISFWVNSQGHFLYSVNEGREYLLMKGLLVSWPLWVIIDVYGTTQEVQLLDPSMTCVSQNKSAPQPSLPVRVNKPQTSSSCSSASYTTPAKDTSGSSSSVPKVSSTPSPQGSASVDEECIVCCSCQVDSVLYRCGHMCVCYSCGQKLLSKNSKCPICRQPIKEIIKTYRS
ncbi:E3 ubiquitin-protein ligase NEURL3-like isoform X2 [Hemiscyllium ocellatum]|uniref:E3 ubiquitin-protein ligase NEURL3-like isoform X2 n=1 Tax=Hemiscyllium ocellatum TaxID=170820 RepID=UPI0029668AF1|nr:E3 ubiquitin-protein ligase NEURL3-like isoform X2 [Hemiscyllium ocellatum]